MGVPALGYGVCLRLLLELGCPWYRSISSFPEEFFAVDQVLKAGTWCGRPPLRATT